MQRLASTLSRANFNSPRDNDCGVPVTDHEGQLIPFKGDECSLFYDAEQPGTQRSCGKVVRSLMVVQ
jgi:hypothetical protein